MVQSGVAVLDVGSSKITAIFGDRGVNGTFAVKAYAEVPYNGFAEGRFFDEEETEKAVLQAVSEIADNVRCPVAEVCVGVPGAFVRLENRKYKIALKKKRKIKNGDITDLFDAGRRLVEIAGYEVISESAIYFALDDNRKVFDPIGNVSDALGGNLTYFLAENYFVVTMKKALSQAGVTKTDFVFDGFAEGTFLLAKEQRETPVLLVDSGYIATTSSILLGDGVVAKDSFDFGGGYVTAALLEKYSLSLDSAEKLKRTINLGFSDPGESVYRIDTEEGLREFPVRDVNEIAVECLDVLAGNIDTLLEENILRTRSPVRVYLTGGGVSCMRGAKEYIAGRIGLAVEILKPPVPHYNKPYESSKLGILDYALRKKEEKKKKFLFF